MFYGSNMGIILCSISLFIAAICILFLLRKIQRQKLEISALVKEKTNDSLLQRQKNPLGKLFEQDTKSMSLSLTKDGKMIALSSSLLELLGYTKKQLVGKNIYGTLMPVPSKHEPLEMNIVHRIIQNPKLYTDYETELTTKSGEKVWISWTNRILTDKSGKPSEIKSVGFDITPRKKLEEELQFIASKDPKTGALNRLSLLEVGTRELKRSIRYKHDFSVLALRLLSLNDNLPSLKVESLLKNVVSACRHTIRDVDYLGRIGEAEFIMLLPETSEKNVPFLEKRLEEKISDYNKKNPNLPIQVSFGKSSYTNKTKSIDELISKAILNIKKRKIK